MGTRLRAILLLSVVLSGRLIGQTEEPFRFLAIGDSGSGTEDQGRIAGRMWEWRERHPYNLVLMLGDNIYGNTEAGGGGSPKRFPAEFDQFYQRFLDQGVRFRAALGNHDLQTGHGKYEIADERRFGIAGPLGYYEFSPAGGLVDFFALNSQLRGRQMHAQIDWLKEKLRASTARWKVVFLHQPLYTPPGRHGPDRAMRAAIEESLNTYGVQLVLAGHNHFYARMKPIGGVEYVVSGGGGRHLYHPAADACTEVVREQFHFVAFDVYPDRIHLSAVDADGVVFDDKTLDAPYLAAATKGCPTPEHIPIEE
jgi:acid phosphatase